MANQTNFTTNKIYYKQRFIELLNNWGKFAPGTVDEVMTFCDKQFNQLLLKEVKIRQKVLIVNGTS